MIVIIIIIKTIHKKSLCWKLTIVKSNNMLHDLNLQWIIKSVFLSNDQYYMSLSSKKHLKFRFLYIAKTHLVANLGTTPRKQNVGREIHYLSTKATFLCLFQENSKPAMK